MYRKEQRWKGNRIMLAEARLVYDGLYCVVDILYRNDDGWDIGEVKSSTSVRSIINEWK